VRATVCSLATPKRKINTLYIMIPWEKESLEHPRLGAFETSQLRTKLPALPVRKFILNSPFIAKPVNVGVTVLSYVPPLTISVANATQAACLTLPTTERPKVFKPFV